MSLLGRWMAAQLSVLVYMMDIVCMIDVTDKNQETCRFDDKVLRIWRETQIKPKQVMDGIWCRLASD